MRLTLLAVLLSACAGSDPDLTPREPEEEQDGHVVTYHLDTRDECAPADGQWEAVGAAFSAWQAFGVELVESESPAPSSVAVCIRPGEFWGWRYGATVSSPDGVRMDLRADIDQPGSHRVLWSIAAHEILHVVLATNEHSPARGLTGIRVCSDCDGFTADDVAWVQSFGLAYEPR
jgi:hypothetical protein